MILRRFMKHVTDQNWFAVGLDVLVVITGIFLGMQVTEWNEGLKEEAEERVYLQRLLEELNENVAYAEGDIAETQTFASNARQVAAAFSHKSLNEMPEAEFREKFMQLVYWNRMEFHDSIIQEMLATGKIALIQSPEIRTAISNILLTVETRNIVAQNVGQLLMNHSMKIAPLIETEMVEGQVRLVSKIDPLLRNRPVHQHVIEMARFHQVLPEDSLLLKAEILELKNLVAAEIKRLNH